MKLFDSAIGKTITTRPSRFRALSSRCGVFPYLISGKLVWQFRSEDEVFNQDSIDSFLDASITIGHPDDDSDLSESHGTVYKVDSIRDSVQDSNEEPGIYCEFLVFTDEAKELSLSGIPTSPMYDVVVVERPGVYEGKNYDYVQTNIRYTSLGLVPKARQEKTKVYYQLSKDSDLILPSELIEIPVIDMSKKLSDPLLPPVILTTTQGDTEAATTELPLEPVVNEVPIVTEPAPVESVVSVETSEPGTPVEPPEIEGSSVVELNSTGGVNIQRDYLDEVIDVAQRASNMGLLSFNEAMQYSLSSMETLMRMILLKEGIQIDQWENAQGAYKVYMQLRPLTPTLATTPTSTTNSDSGIKLPPLVPKINHPMHVKPTTPAEPLELPKIVTFDDLE